MPASCLKLLAARALHLNLRRLEEAVAPLKAAGLASHTFPSNSRGVSAGMKEHKGSG